MSTWWWGRRVEVIILITEGICTGRFKVSWLSKRWDNCPAFLPKNDYVAKLGYYFQ